MSLYAAVGTSFEPAFDAAATGVALSDLPTQATNPNLDPEESRNYEVGAKWQTDDARLGLTAAVFRTEKFNARTRTTTDDAFTLDGEQEVTGVELSMSGDITERWSAFAGYVYMDSEFEESANPVEQGHALVFTPENSFNFWTSYTLPIGLELGVGGQFMDSCSVTSPARPKCRATGSSTRWRPIPSTTRSRCSSTPRTSPTRSTSTASAAAFRARSGTPAVAHRPVRVLRVREIARGESGRIHHAATNCLGALGRGACPLPAHARRGRVGRRFRHRRPPVRACQGERAAPGGFAAGA